MPSRPCLSDCALPCPSLSPGFTKTYSRCSTPCAASTCVSRRRHSVGERCATCEKISSVVSNLWDLLSREHRFQGSTVGAFRQYIPPQSTTGDAHRRPERCRTFCDRAKNKQTSAGKIENHVVSNRPGVI